MILPFLLNIPSVFVRLWSNPTENSENVGMLWKINKSRLRWLADVIKSCFPHNREQIKHITFILRLFTILFSWNSKMKSFSVQKRNFRGLSFQLLSALHVQYSIPKSNHATMKHWALLLPIYQCYQGATCKIKPNNKKKKGGYKLWNNFRIMFLNMKVWIFLSSAV